MLSFPPIINGELTSVTEETQDLFIDVTGMDGMVFKALNIVVTSLAERGGRIESVLVKRKEGDFLSPNLEPSSWTVSSAEANRLIGFDLSSEELAAALEKMRFGARAEGDLVQVQVPAYRADIMHSWDIFEDAAKAYGFDRLEARLPQTVTVGRAHPSEVRKGEIRELFAGLGYLETMPFTLTNEKMHFQWMRRENSPECAGAVRVMHPISELHTILRTSLLSSLLEIFAMNQHHTLPQRIFAAGDVVVERKTRMNLAAAPYTAGPISPRSGRWPMPCCGSWDGGGDRALPGWSAAAGEGGGPDGGGAQDWLLWGAASTGLEELRAGAAGGGHGDAVGRALREELFSSFLAKA